MHSSELDNGASRMWKGLLPDQLQYLFVAVLMVFGLILRFAHLGRSSLWLDEGATAAIASMDWSSFWKVMFSREMNMVAYYCVLRLFPVLQHSESWLRMVSVVFGTGLIVSVWLLAKEVLNDKPEGLWPLAAAALIAVNGFLIAYSQEARGYAMAVCLLTLSTFALGVVLRTGKLRATWCVLTLLAVYSHFYTVLWIAPQVWALLMTHRHRGRKFFARIIAVTAVGLLPLLLFCFRTRGGQLDWVPRLTPHYFFDMLVQLTGFSRVALILLCAGSIAGCIHLWNRGDMFSRLIVVLNILPISVLLACSTLHPLFVPRFLIFSIPFLTLTAVAGFAAMPIRLGCFTLALSIAMMAIVGDRSAPKSDWRGMTEYLCSQRGQAVAFWPPMQKFPYWYYAQSNFSCPKQIFPEQREVTISDFRGSKPDFVRKICSSGEESVLMVVDADSQSKSTDLASSCYTPVSVTSRDGLQLFKLRRIGSPDRPNS